VPRCPSAARTASRVHAACDRCSVRTPAWDSCTDVYRFTLFHTSLTGRVVTQLVKLFQSPASNPKGAQIIFNSHEASLLGDSKGDRVLAGQGRVNGVRRRGRGILGSGAGTHGQVQHRPRAARRAVWDREEPSGRRIPVDSPYEEPKGALLNVIALANRCRGVWSKDVGLMTVIGFPADLDAVELLFTSGSDWKKRLPTPLRRPSMSWPLSSGTVPGR
jgi:hypothetical protein